MPALEGKRALREYRSQEPASLYLIPERWGDHCGAIYRGASLPDFADLPNQVSDDLYLFPESLEWTLVLTHEHPHHGPYFSRREWCEE